MAESLANVIMEITFVSDPTSAVATGATTRIPIDPANHFQSLTIDVQYVGAWTGSMTLFDPDTADATGVPYLERLILSTGFNHRLEIRWGYDLPGWPFERNPVYIGGITKITPNFDIIAGTSYTLELASGNLDSTLGSPVSPGSFPAGALVSDVVNSIAAANNWPLRTYANGKTSIETTTSTMPIEVSMVNGSHFQYVNDVIRKFAASPLSSAYYCFFDIDGTFHFHTAEYLPVVVANYRFRDIDGQVLSFSFENNSIFNQAVGGGNNVWVGADSDAGTFPELTQTVGEGVTDASGNLLSPASVLGTSTEFATPTSRAQRTAMLSRTLQEMQSRVLSIYKTYEATTFMARMSVRGTHLPALLTYVSFEKQRANGTLHPASGYYNIRGLTQNVAQGRWTTELTLMRSALIPDPPNQTNGSSGLPNKSAIAVGAAVSPVAPTNAPTPVVVTPQRPTSEQILEARSRSFKRSHPVSGGN